jgi:hypothetical protein
MATDLQSAALLNGLSFEQIKIQFQNSPMDYRRERGNCYQTVKFSDDDLSKIVVLLEAILGRKPSQAKAAKLTLKLLGGFREANYPNADIFAATLAEVFSEHSEQAGDDVARSLPRTQKFTPAISEVVEALEAIERPMVLVMRSAKIILESRAQDCEANRVVSLKRPGKSA